MPTNLPKKNFKYTLKDFYREYRKEERKSGKAIKDIWTWKQYKAIMGDMLKATARKIIQKDWVFIMPLGLGRLHIHSYKGRSLATKRIDPNASKRLKRTILMQSKTFGRIYVWKWSKRGCAFKNKSYYTFTPVNSRKARDGGGGRKGLAEYVVKKHNKTL